MNTTTLKGRAVSSQLQIQPDALDYRAGSKMEGKKYHRAIFNNMVFPVNPEVYNDWKAGNIAEITIVETSRVVKDVETNEEKDVLGLAYGGHATWTQITNIVENESKLMVIEKKALASIKLDEAAISKLEEAV